jgi:hypothetical protein
MTRQQMIEILCQELERSAERLPPNYAKHLADMRAGANIGEGIEAAIRAMARVEKECDAER